MTAGFADRADAGRSLAARLGRRAGQGEIVLALPRGGVPVAAPVAAALGVPLDVLMVRKLGVPGREELAMGAVASGGLRVLDRRVIAAAQVSEEQLERVTRLEIRRLEAGERRYRAGRRALSPAGRSVVVVDDGIATGSTMRVAVRALRLAGAAAIVVAAPVAPPETCDELAPEVDELVTLLRPAPFEAVGVWYRDFSPVPEGEVRRLLAASRV